MFEHVQAIGHHKCQGLLGFNHFSGADWGGKFVGITKKWANVYLRLEDNNDPANQCFKELVKAPFNLNLLMMSSQ